MYEIGLIVKCLDSCFYLDSDTRYYRFAVKYFDPQDIILSVFCFKKFASMETRWSLVIPQCICGTNDLSQTVQSSETRESQRMIPIAKIKPSKRVKKVSENNPLEVVDLASEDDLPLVNFRDASE